VEEALEGQLASLIEEENKLRERRLKLEEVAQELKGLRSRESL